MKSRVVRQITGAALFALLAMPAQTIAQIQDQEEPRHSSHYRVTDLGTLGGLSSQAFAINKGGNVAGAANLPAENQHAFLWRRGHMSDLGTLGGSNSNEGGLNDRDELAIFSEITRTDPYVENFCDFGTPLICRAGVWKNGRMTPFPTLGGNNAQALAINNKGWIAGAAENGTQDSSCLPPQVFDFEAAIWEPDGKIHELPPLPGDTVGFALWMNDNSQVVGSSGLCKNTIIVGLEAGPHAVLWEKDGLPINLGGLGGKLLHTAAGINDRGQVDGCSDLPSEIPGFPSVQCHGFLWTKDTGMKDIGTVGGDFSSLPTSINNHGQIVGASCDSSGNCRAFLRQDKKMRDLNALIPKDSPLYLLFGQDINEAGEIVGFGVQTSTGDVHAFLATPCDRDGGEWCGDEGQDAAAEGDETTERPRPVLSENARKLLQQQLGRRYHIAGAQ